MPQAVVNRPSREPCRLDHALGRAAECPESACPFWEPGGAVVEGRCAFDRLDLASRRQLAEELAGLRTVLLAAAGAEERNEARRTFYRLLNEGAGFDG